MKKISKRTLQKVLNESAESSDMMKLIIEVGNVDYLEIRAIELIKESRLHLQDNAEVYHYGIRQAIALLAYARIERGAVEAKKEETRSEDSTSDHK